MTPEILCFIIAWFLQMGAHEGAHAWAAWWCGDDTAYLMGKRTFDPFKHVNWRDLNSVIFAVILPITTAFHGIPMGMAWVPINPLRFRRFRRDWALVSFAGPLANFIVAALLLVVHHLLPRDLDSVWLERFDGLVYAVYITSLVYGLFNLVPLPPLDGSRVLYFFLPMRVRPFMESIEPYGMWLIIIIFWFGNGIVILTPFFVLFRLLWVI